MNQQEKEQNLKLFCEGLQLADNLTKKYGAIDGKVINLLCTYWLISDRGRLKGFALLKAVLQFCQNLVSVAYTFHLARGSANRLDA